MCGKFGELDMKLELINHSMMGASRIRARRIETVKARRIERARNTRRGRNGKPIRPSKSDRDMRATGRIQDTELIRGAPCSAVLPSLIHRAFGIRAG